MFSFFELDRGFFTPFQGVRNDKFPDDNLGGDTFARRSGQAARINFQKLNAPVLDPISPFPFCPSYGY